MGRVGAPGITEASQKVPWRHLPLKPADGKRAGLNDPAKGVLRDCEPLVNAYRDTEVSFLCPPSSMSHDGGCVAGALAIRLGRTLSDHP